MEYELLQLKNYLQRPLPLQSPEQQSSSTVQEAFLASHVGGAPQSSSQLKLFSAPSQSKSPQQKSPGITGCSVHA